MFNDIIISQALQKFARRGCEISALGDAQNAIWEGNGSSAWVGIIWTGGWTEWFPKAPEDLNYPVFLTQGSRIYYPRYL